MDKIKLEILGLSSSQSHSGSFALILGEEQGRRRLPIIIGMFEAQAIAIEIEKIAPNRPMTHDLFLKFSEGFNYQIKEIYISDLNEGIFFAKIVAFDEIKTVEIDSRPSDAIAIGLRFDVPIFTNEKVMSEAGIILEEEEFDENEKDDDTVDDELEKELVSNSNAEESDITEMPLDKLEELLNQALANEDYENAARIRDEINNRTV